MKEKFKINFNTVVRDVKYDNDSKEFTVRVKDGLKNEMGEKQTFDYVIVASGHYSVPHIPSFPGIETFPGIVTHAHDFRDPSAYKGQNVLLVGASYSAEDISLQLIKVLKEYIIIDLFITRKITNLILILKKFKFDCILINCSCVL